VPAAELSSQNLVDQAAMSIYNRSPNITTTATIHQRAIISRKKTIGRRRDARQHKFFQSSSKTKTSIKLQLRLTRIGWILDKELQKVIENS
jgi:hypothetical protein